LDISNYRAVEVTDSEHKNIYIVLEREEETSPVCSGCGNVHGRSVHSRGTMISVTLNLYRMTNNPYKMTLNDIFFEAIQKKDYAFLVKVCLNASWGLGYGKKRFLKNVRTLVLRAFKKMGKHARIIRR
jgi:hypothetical protein